MNGSTQSIYLALGCAAALTVSACSRPSQSPSSPSLGQGAGVSSPAGQSPEMTGGSNTQQPGLGSDRESQSTGQPGSMQHGDQGDAHSGGSPGMGQHGSGAGQHGSGATQHGNGAGQQGSGAGQQGTGMGAQGGQAGGAGTMGGTNGAPSAVDEREACDRLTSEATLRAEPTEGGVTIIARPRRGVDLSTLRSSMQSVQRGIERGTPSSATAACDLFTLARTGVVAIAETPDSIRLLVTTSEAARVPQIRRQANEFIRTAKGASTQQNGGQKGGTQKGGTQRGGGAQDRNGGGTQQDGGTQGGGGTPQGGGGTQNQGGGTQNQGGGTPQPGGGTPQGGTP